MLRIAPAGLEPATWARNRRKAEKRYNENMTKPPTSLIILRFIIFKHVLNLVLEYLYKIPVVA